jgi:hypothetical protein
MHIILKEMLASTIIWVASISFWYYFCNEMFRLFGGMSSTAYALYLLGFIIPTVGLLIALVIRISVIGHTTNNNNITILK